MNGIVFNIQKFSLHDGPGIRTTVFLKGCPLKCAWCANPESQLDKIQILYNQDNCVHCLACVNHCPHQAITYSNDHIDINSDICQGCLSCVSICPNAALKNEGNNKTIEDVVRVCLQDIDFYEESNGGVTISGGEGMAQPAFLKELVSELKKHNIHVAIETTGYIHHDLFKELASMFDLLLFDVKHYDTNKHFEGTKVHNELIIENLKWAIENNIEVLPRVPVIPDFNASLEDAKGIADLLILVKAKQVQLLPFHQFGENKYKLLNKEYIYKDKKALYPEDLSDYRQIFIDKGLNCFF